MSLQNGRFIEHWLDTREALEIPHPRTIGTCSVGGLVIYMCVARMTWSAARLGATNSTSCISESGNRAEYVPAEPIIASGIVALQGGRSGPGSPTILDISINRFRVTRGTVWIRSLSRLLTRVRREFVIYPATAPLQVPDVRGWAKLNRNILLSITRSIALPVVAPSKRH